MNGKVTQAVDGEKARQSGWGRGISAISRDRRCVSRVSLWFLPCVNVARKSTSNARNGERFQAGYREGNANNGSFAPN